MSTSGQSFIEFMWPKIGDLLVGVFIGVLLGISISASVVACEAAYANAAVACGGTDDVAACRAQAAEDYVACEGGT